MIIKSIDDLRKISEHCDLDHSNEIVKKLDLELVNSAKNGFPGIGLSAPQIGIYKRVAIIRTEKESINLVNPVIEKSYDLEMFSGEGCLSFPNQFENTLRYQEIHVKNDIEPKNFIATGLLAVVIAHEIDHLDGKLLPDFAIKKKAKNRPNDPCSCGSGKKYKKCCG